MHNNLIHYFVKLEAEVHYCMANTVFIYTIK